MSALAGRMALTRHSYSDILATVDIVLENFDSNPGKHQLVLVDNSVLLHRSPHASLILVIIDWVPMLLFTPNGGGVYRCVILMGCQPFFQALEDGCGAFSVIPSYYDYYFA